MRSWPAVTTTQRGTGTSGSTCTRTCAAVCFGHAPAAGYWASGGTLRIAGWVDGWVAGVEADAGGADLGCVGDAVEDAVTGVETGGDAVMVGVAVVGDVSGAAAPV